MCTGADSRESGTEKVKDDGGFRVEVVVVGGEERGRMMERGSERRGRRVERSK